MTIYSVVSRLQFPMLREFITVTARGGFVSVKEAERFDQRPFGSLYHRGWLGYRAGRGFYATAAGKDAYAEYMGEARRRARPESPMSHYFDLVAAQFHKKPENPAKLHKVA